jgi:hypothetical protein
MTYLEELQELEMFERVAYALDAWVVLYLTNVIEEDSWVIEETYMRSFYALD